MCFQDIRIYFRTLTVKVIKVGQSVAVTTGSQLEPHPLYVYCLMWMLKEEFWYKAYNNTT